MNLPGDGDMPRLELTHNFGVDSYDVGTGTGTSRSRPTTSTARWPSSQAGNRAGEASLHVREGGSRLCFVRDPDGYRVELIEKPTADQTR